MREQHSLRLFENRVLREIFRPESNEITGEWRRLHNEEICDLYCSPNVQIKKNEMDGTCSTYGGEES